MIYLEHLPKTPACQPRIVVDGRRQSKLTSFVPDVQVFLYFTQRCQIGVWFETKFNSFGIKPACLSTMLFCILADVISIEKTNENFRLLYDVKGRFTVHRIKPEEAKVTKYIKIFL